MPTSVRLDKKTGMLVERLAREDGRTRSDVIREAIVTYGSRRGSSSARTLYDIISPYVGVTKGGPTDLSERTGEKFLAALVAQKKERDRRAPSPRRNRKK